VDLIITPKLHVGIVGAALGKSVLSFPYHIHKIKRYYRQIGEEDRCVLLKDITESVAYDKLIKYCSIPITVNDSFRDLAQKNLNALEELAAKL